MKIIKAVIPMILFFFSSAGQEISLNEYGRIVKEDRFPHEAVYTPYEETFKIEKDGVLMIGDSMFEFENGYVTIEAYEAAAPSTLRVYARDDGALRFKADFPQIINFHLSNNKEHAAFFDGKRVVTVDLKNYHYTDHPGGVIFSVDDEGTPVYFDPISYQIIYGDEKYPAEHHIIRFLFLDETLIALDRKSAAVILEGSVEYRHSFNGIYFDGIAADGMLYVVDRIGTNGKYHYQLYKSRNGKEFHFMESIIREAMRNSDSENYHERSIDRREPIRTPLQYYEDDVELVVGNAYGQIQEIGSLYLHPGIDFVGDEYEEVYSVMKGEVKAIITISGSLHWRVAISNEFTDQLSTGYLYAHLVEDQIPVQVGDTVQAGEVVGTLVPWPGFEYHHVHFARIEHEGEVWDGNWWTTDNPLVDMVNIVDTIPPYFVNAIGDDQFAFRTLDGEYLSPDSLYGEIDIISEAYDPGLHGPAWRNELWEIHYKIYPVDEPESPIMDQLGFRFDFPLDTYLSPSPYDNLLLFTIYSRDGTLNSTGGYPPRNHYHIITNSRGTGNINEEDQLQYFDTAEFPDGEYVVEVTVIDAAMNEAAASMNVEFRNIPTYADDEKEDNLPAEFSLSSNYPNPFNPSTVIEFSLPVRQQVEITVYNVLGEKIDIIAEGEFNAGVHTVTWSVDNLPSGVYYYRLQAGEFIMTKPMLFVK